MSPAESKLVNFIFSGLIVCFQIYLTIRLTKSQKDHDSIIRTEEHIKSIENRLKKLENGNDRH